MRNTASIALATAFFLCTAATADAGGVPRRFKVLKGHDNFITQLSMDAKGITLASIAQDATVRVWSVKRGKAVMKITAPDTEDFGIIALSPNGKKLAVTLGSEIRLYAVSAKKKKGKKGGATTFATFKGHEGEIKALSFDAAGTTLASAGADGVKLWSTETTNNIGDLAKGKACLDVALSPTDGTIAAIFKDGLQVFDRTSQKPNKVQKIAEKELKRVIWSPSGKSLVLRTGEGKILVVAPDGKPKTAKGGFADDTAYGLAHGGKVLIGGISDKKIKGYETATGKLQWTLGGSATVAFMAVAGNVLAAASAEGTNHIWVFRIP